MESISSLGQVPQTGETITVCRKLVGVYCDAYVQLISNG
jgi:hypothetical protein